MTFDTARGDGGEPVRSSLQEYGRGVAGGLLFSLPLLYTMEVWWAGFLTESWVLLFCIGVTFLLLLGYNRYGGIRRDVHRLDILVDSVEEFGLAVLLATLVLFLLDRITFDMPRSEILGKIIVESMLVAIGVSVGTAQLGGVDEDEQQDSSTEKGMAPESNSREFHRHTDEGSSTHASQDRSSDTQPQADQHRPERPPILKQVVLSYCGAVLLGANIAPTEEIVIIAAESPSWKLLGLSALSLAIGWLVLYFSAFHRSGKHYPGDGPWNKLAIVVATYAIALLASAMLLWFFGRFNDGSLAAIVSQTIVLGFAANMGASAGRLLIE